jgi:hypothetical protein
VENISRVSFPIVSDKFDYRKALFRHGRTPPTKTAENGAYNYQRIRIGAV